MNEGVGGTTIVTIIIVFLALVLAYLAYNVNYTKAFRMKNKIISIYEEYDGKCTEACNDKIVKYAKEIGYTVSGVGSLRCDDYENSAAFRTDKTSSVISHREVSNLYCEYQIEVDHYSDFKDIGKQYYYRIMTKIDIDIPIVKNLIGLNVMSISGDTITFDEK